MRAVFALWLAAIVAACNAQRCVSGGLYNDVFDECFHFFNVTQSFADASFVCGAIGGVLASVHNAFEQAYVLDNSVKRFGSSDYWIGLSDLQHNDKWTWADGVESTYSNWGKGFPSGIGKDCVATMIKGGKWYNANCSQKLYFACQVKPNADYQDPNRFCAGDKLMFGKCYYYFNNVAQSNADATTTCANLLGSLVAIHNEDEQNYLLEVLAMHPMDGDYWLGLRDRNDEGHWQWDDDSSSDVSFTNWDWGYPFDNVSLDCAVATADDGKWYNVMCNLEIDRFICETAAGVSTTSAVTAVAGSTTAWFTDVWTYFNFTNSWYKFYVEEKSQAAAEKDCVHDGGHLTSIHSMAEDYFIRGLADASIRMWIGLSCQDSDDCAWSDGSAYDFLNWNEPGIGTNFCTQMIADGRWDEYYCEIRWPFVCKRSN